MYNCYNIDRNNTTLHVIRGVLPQRGFPLCCSDGSVSADSYSTLPLPNKNSLRLINHCGRDFWDKSSGEPTKRLHPVSAAHQCQMHPEHGFTGQHHEHGVTAQDDCCAIETSVNVYKQIQGMEDSTMGSVGFQGSVKQLSSESDESLHCEIFKKLSKQ